MAWLIGLVGVIGVVWALIASPRFRIAAVVVVGGLAAIIYIFIASENQREAKSHTLIMPSQLDLNIANLGKSYGSWSIAGTIKNNSAYTLTSLKLKVTVRDCAPNCVTIGEDDAYVWVTVPPSQLRSFDKDIYFSNMPTPKNPTWNYQLIETTAQ
jgi:hypothetical protein